MCRVLTRKENTVSGMTTRHHNVEELHFQLRSKAVLHNDEMELYELSQLAGITVDPEIFKIILDLLKLNVAPVALANTLRSMCAPQQNDSSLGDSSQTGLTRSSSHDRGKRPDSFSGHASSSLTSSTSHSHPHTGVMRKSKSSVASSRPNPNISSRSNPNITTRPKPR